MKTLVVKAANRPNVSVTIYANKSILPNASGSSNEKIALKIPATEQSAKRDTILAYGFGHWGNAGTLAEFAGKIDSIVILNSTGKTIINNQNDINSYLVKNRHGFAKNILTIEAK